MNASSGVVQQITLFAEGAGVWLGDIAILARHRRNLNARVIRIQIVAINTRLAHTISRIVLAIRHSGGHLGAGSGLGVGKVIPRGAAGAYSRQAIEVAGQNTGVGGKSVAGVADLTVGVSVVVETVGDASASPEGAGVRGEVVARGAVETSGGVTVDEAVGDGAGLGAGCTGRAGSQEESRVAERADIRGAGPLLAVGDACGGRAGSGVDVEALVADSAGVLVVVLAVGDVDDVARSDEEVVVGVADSTGVGGSVVEAVRGAAGDGRADVAVQVEVGVAISAGSYRAVIEAVGDRGCTGDN